MIEKQDVARFDQKRLYSVYTSWSKYFGDALRFLDGPSISRPAEDYNSLVVCGMGGSATNCDILHEIMNLYGSIPTITLRNQQMPSFVNSRSLVIVSSVSGNTEESLLMMRNALNRNAEVVAISSGGKLREESDKAKCIHIEIPNISLPRASLPYLLIPALAVIDPFLKTSLKDEIISIPKTIDTTIRDTMIDVTEDSNVAKKIGRFMLDGFPFCYSSPSLLPAATRFKNSLNENAKLHCIRESILEASHNDIVPFTYDNALQTPRIIHLRWNHDPVLIKQRFDKVHSLFEKVVQSVMEVSISDKNLLTALISAIYILDLSTIYVAIANNTDPSATPAIQILKDI